MEYLKVSFPEDRGVKVDGRPAGRTNVVVEIEGGTHSVTLDGPRDFAPPSQPVVLDATTVVGPKEISFRKIALPAPPPPAQPPDPR